LSAETGEGCGPHDAHLGLFFFGLEVDWLYCDVVDVFAIGPERIVDLQFLGLLLDSAGIRTLAALKELKLRDIPFAVGLPLLESSWDVLQLSEFVGQTHPLQFAMLL